MFSKSKQVQPEVTPAPVAAPASSLKPRDRSVRSPVPSIISGDLTVRGTIISSGDVQIDGRIEGDVRAGALVIGEKAYIEGDVFAEDAIIRGTVHGGIRARKVQLCSTSRVEGNILHEALAMEAGAFFEGNCRHSDNPLADRPTEDDAPRPVAAKPMAQSLPGTKPIATPMRANGTDAAPVAAPRPATPAASFTPLKA
jgi:cytoskeletal protein CcmA (bactofilin family)